MGLAVGDDEFDGDEEPEDKIVSDVDTTPNEAADPPSIIEAKVPADIRAKYELLSYRNAAVILSETRRPEFEELLGALRSFTISTDMIRRAGGNESDIPKLITAALRPRGWHETIIQGDLVVRLSWREQGKRGKTRGGCRRSRPGRRPIAAPSGPMNAIAVRLRRIGA
jgi:hypothetical protein